MVLGLMRGGTCYIHFVEFESAATAYAIRRVFNNFLSVYRNKQKVTHVELVSDEAHLDCEQIRDLFLNDFILIFDMKFK